MYLYISFKTEYIAYSLPAKDKHTEHRNLFFIELEVYFNGKHLYF